MKILNEHDFEEFLVKKKNLTAKLKGLKLKEKINEKIIRFKKNLKLKLKQCNVSFEEF